MRLSRTSVGPFHVRSLLGLLSPLTPRRSLVAGRQQAKGTGERWSRGPRFGRLPPVDLVVSSPLSRAIDTAMLVFPEETSRGPARARTRRRMDTERRRGHAYEVGRGSVCGRVCMCPRAASNCPGARRLEHFWQDLRSLRACVHSVRILEVGRERHRQARPVRFSFWVTMAGYRLSARRRVELRYALWRTGHSCVSRTGVSVTACS